MGAVLGYSLAKRGSKRVIAMIGDGSFQMTAQEVSTMIRYQCDPIIFLINNKCVHHSTQGLAGGGVSRLGWSKGERICHDS